jgi:uncharacterized protein (DUF1499 family)
VTRIWLLIVALAVAGCAAHREDAMPRNGAPLAPCPSSPNCVSSLATDDAHRGAPLAYRGDAAAAMQRLRSVIAALPRTRIVSADDTAVRAEFTSRLFRFVDDVDCVADPAAGVIQIRSASRVGYSDLGANRKRVDAIRAAFDAAAS